MTALTVFEAALDGSTMVSAPRARNRSSISFSWEIDFWGKNRAAVAAATSDAKATEADAAAARLVLSTAVAASYADLARLFADRVGFASATTLAEAGASVVLNGRGKAKVEAAARQPERYFSPVSLLWHCSSSPERTAGFPDFRRCDSCVRAIGAGRKQPRAALDRAGILRPRNPRHHAKVQQFW
jgi:hypothetical protein